MRNLHVSGGEVNVSLELLAEVLDDGQADALVTTGYHCNPAGHVCPQRVRIGSYIKYLLPVES